MAKVYDTINLEWKDSTSTTISELAPIVGPSVVGRQATGEGPVELLSMSVVLTMLNLNRLGAVAKIVPSWDDALENGFYTTNPGDTSSPNSALPWTGIVTALSDKVIEQYSWYSTPGNLLSYARSSYDNDGVLAWNGWNLLRLTKAAQDVAISEAIASIPATKSYVPIVNRGFNTNISYAEGEPNVPNFIVTSEGNLIFIKV